MITSSPVTVPDEPFTLAERNDRRATLAVTFNVWEKANRNPPEPPDNPKGPTLLLLLDDGNEGTPQPSWDRYTFVLQPGGSLLLSRTTPPLPVSRVTALLSMPGDQDIDDYVVKIGTASYTDETC